MSEGDVQGYPDIEGMKEKGIMTFCMPSWFVRACNEPVVLFLDEFNRGLRSVQQSFFQIVLDRQLGNDENGNPYNIHPETRIFAPAFFASIQFSKLIPPSISMSIFNFFRSTISLTFFILSKTFGINF